MTLFRSLRERVRMLSGVLVAGAVGGVLISRGTPSWWLGAALVCAAVAALWQVTREPLGALRAKLAAPRSVRGISFVPLVVLVDVVYVGALGFIASVMMLDILGGDRVVSHDHTAHYFKAWQLHEHFLPQGKLQGWSHRWFAGDAVNYLYPVGADLWVCVVHALSFGLLTFSEAYARAFWLFHVLTGYAGYRLGRAVGGPHVGFLSGLLLLTDLSDFRLGGWAYTINYGVWPQAFSLDLALLALCHLPAIVEGRRLAPIGWFGLLMGLAILTHPMQLIFLAAIFVVVALAGALADGVRVPAALGRLALGTLIALLVAAVWLVPFWGTRDESSVMGIWWDTTWEMGKGVLRLDAFPGTLGWALAAGLLGLVVVLRTRRFFAVFTGLLALFVPLAFGSTFVDELHLPVISGAMGKIQFVRMATTVKPFWFALAAYFLVAAVSRARLLALGASGEPAQGRQGPLASGGVAFVVALLTLPIAVPAGQAFWTRHVAKRLETESTRPFANDRRAMVDWITRNLPEQGFYRIGVNTGHFHDLFDLGTAIDKPIWKRGFTPATNFKYRPREEDRSVLEAVNVRYVLAKRFLPPEDFELLQRFGVYRVYRFKYWRPQPFEILDGEGDVKVERFADEEIVLRAGPGSHGTLRLNVSYFSRWHATRDGKSLSISTSTLAAEPQATGFMTVPLAPGRYRFAFERTPSDRAALPITLLGLLVVSALVLVDRRRRGLGWVAMPIEAATRALEVLSSDAWRRRRQVAIAAGAFGLTAIWIALAEWRPPMRIEELERTAVERVRYDFLENVGQARAFIDYPQASHRCRRFNDRHVCRDESGNLDNERYVASSPAEITEYTMVRCIRARPEKDAVLHVRYRDVPVGDAIVGYYGIERAGRLLKRKRPVAFAIRLNGAVHYDGATQEDNKMHWFEVPMSGLASEDTEVLFSIRSDNVSKRYFCFHAQVVDWK